jgi:hypothetical protein
MWEHEGSRVIRGTKYTVRTDLMYTWLTNEQIEVRKAELLAMQCGLCQ